MASATLLAAGLTSIVTGLGFGLVAHRVSQSVVSPASTVARRAQATWWAGLGAYLVLQGAMTVAASRDALDPGLYLASRAVAIPLLCAAVWGISTYLLFLFTGSRRVAPLMAALYVAIGAVFAYATFVERPAIVVQRWLVGFEDSSPVYRAIYLLVGLPPIAASVAYLSLLRRTRQPLQRYRTLLTGASILLYVAAGLAARLSASDVVVFLTLIPVGLLAAVAALAAHFPPAAVRRRLGSIVPPSQGNAQLAQRLRELL